MLVLGFQLLCCSVIPVFRRYSGIPPFFRGVPAIPLVFCNPLFRIPVVFRCSAGVPCSVVPCSGVPGCIVCLKTVTLYKKLSFFSLKVLKARKEAGNNFALLCESRKMADQLKKAYLHRSFKILHFFTPARIQK